MNLYSLHLGCSTKRLPGFVHIDIRPDVHPDIVSDVKSLSVFPDNSCAIIYFCHGIEHLKYAEVPDALKEWKRILYPGGLLRLSVPDFAKMAYMYYQGNVSLSLLQGVISGQQQRPDNVHYSVWDEKTLTDVLEKTGYSHIRQYDPVGFLPEGYSDWSIGLVAGRSISLNMEARA